MSSLRRAERRQLDGEDVQAVEEVLAQLAVAQRLGGVQIRRGDDTNVDGLLLPSAQTPERPLLQDAQQLHLRRRHHLGDLVEKQRAAMRQLEHAGAAIVRAGEGPFLVAEDLALEQRLRDRGAVDRDERERLPRAQLVNRLRDQLLAGARLAARSAPTPGSAPPAR